MTKTDADSEVIVLNNEGYDPVAVNILIALIAPNGDYAGFSVPQNRSEISVDATKINLCRGALRSLNCL
jgi:hypothetical protein